MNKLKQQVLVCAKELLRHVPTISEDNCWAVPEALVDALGKSLAALADSENYQVEAKVNDPQSIKDAIAESWAKASLDRSFMPENERKVEELIDLCDKLYLSCFPQPTPAATTESVNFSKPENGFYWIDKDVMQGFVSRIVY